MAEIVLAGPLLLLPWMNLPLVWLVTSVHARQSQSLRCPSFGSGWLDQSSFATVAVLMAVSLDG